MVPMYPMPHALPGSGDAEMGYKMLFTSGCPTFLECKCHVSTVVQNELRALNWLTSSTKKRCLVG